MSEISSSSRVTSGAGAAVCDDAFVVGAIAADAPPAIAKDIPAAPQTGKAFCRRFRFEVCFARAILHPPVLFWPAMKINLCAF
jgi:hypothetical protein